MSASHTHRDLVLASSSAYRRKLLERLGLPFSTQSPDIDERPLPNESPEDLVKRLARGKAETVAKTHPGSVVIGSDQIAINQGRILGKPGTLERACTQLSQASGRQVDFLTGLCVLDARDQHLQLDCIPYSVTFRRLDAERIRRYLQIEQPFDCAGSFKSEGLGIALFERFEGEDPNALIGLPLIRLCRMLEQVGLDPLAG